MKTLLLMRHAKSTWKIKNIPDHERPLNKRGRRDAPRMGHLLQERELVPQLILASSALRSRQTAELVAETAGYPGDVIYKDELYMAEPDEYISVLRELDDSLERVLLIGHNPGLESLLQLLSQRIEPLSTAVLAHLALPIDEWSLLNAEVEGELVEIWRPKELPEETLEGKKEKPEAVEKKEEKPKAREKGKKKSK
jgi:phosphohistidine phosphatase